MKGFIDNTDFTSISAQEYWSFPSNWKKSKRKETLSQMIESGEYIASEKKDGYFELIVKDEDGNIFMRARKQGVSGWIFKQDYVPHLYPFFDSLPNGTCLVSEIYFPNGTSKDITKILGCSKEKAIARQEVKKLHLSIFDILAYNGEIFKNKPMKERARKITEIKEFYNNDYVSFVDFYEGENILINWSRILNEGGEGVVLTHKDFPYSEGTRTARKTLKLKKELNDTIDVFLTGKYKEPTKVYNGIELDNWKYWINEITKEKIEGTMADIADISSLTPVTKNWFYGWAGAVQIAVIRGGKITPIGWISGITEEVRKGIVENPEIWKNKVLEIQAMEVNEKDGTPTLRHAKIISWREDKNWKDCYWSINE